ncbi:unnamed protein product [Penicillium glandicola]
MRFFSLAILSLASVAVADLKTWNDVVGDVPQCIKTCLNDFYNTAGLKDKCGSTDTATVDCLCGIQGTASDFQDDASTLSTCIENGCDTSEVVNAAANLEDFLNRFQTANEQCSAKGSSNGASSVVPGFNAMLASGAVLLVGAAL